MSYLDYFIIYSNFKIILNAEEKFYKVYIQDIYKFEV